MAWRGRYKGKGKGTIVYSNSRSKIDNASTIHPLPLYPPLTVNPLPLRPDPDLDQLLNLKRDYRKLLLDSEYYLKNLEVKKDIERYSDKYNEAPVYNWCPDFMGLPSELKVQHKRKSALKFKKTKAEEKKLILKKLDVLEASEAKEENLDEVDDNKEEEKVKKTAEGEGDEEEEEEDDNEDNMEYDEENDYVNNYFDNGEDYEDASDNNDEFY